MKIIWRTKYFKQAGAKIVIIIKAKGKRKRVDSNISFLEKYIIGKHFIIVEEILKKFKGNKDSLKIALHRLEQKGEIERIEIRKIFNHSKNARWRLIINLDKKIIRELEWFVL